MVAMSGPISPSSSSPSFSSFPSFPPIQHQHDHDDNNSSQSGRSYRLAVVAKETNNPYWQTIRSGCLHGASLLQDNTLQDDNFECVFVGPQELDAKEQYEIAKELLETNAVDGMSFAVIEEQYAEELSELALSQSIPFITVDSDAVESKRAAYVGTDNFAFGESLGKVLLQIRPEGGSYGIIYDTAPNLDMRAQGVRHRLMGTLWVEDTEHSPKDCKERNELALQQMYELVDAGVDAVVPVGAWPMRLTEGWIEFVDSNRDIWNVVGDMDEGQLDLMTKKYVHGLVGQVPHEMGSTSMDVLFELITTGNVTTTFSKTGLIEVIQVPLDLPDVDVNENYLGSLTHLGSVLTGIVYLTSIGFIIWTLVFRERRVIRASQPIFLVMVAIGVFMMGSAIIPFGIDDESYSIQACEIACSSILWLLCIGFTMTFTALMSKTWRINQILSRSRFVRSQVTERDVLVPFLALMCLNIVLLSLWTALSPLNYSRMEHEGTDLWNRVISTYGGCVSYGTSAAVYGVLLGVINIGLIITALFQAYKARSIQSEFSESKYIVLTMLSMLQSSAIGIPILILVKDQPRSFYIVGVSMIFINCMSILLLIFVPKVHYLLKYQGSADTEQRAPSSKPSVIPKASFYEHKTRSIHRSEGSRPCHSEDLDVSEGHRSSGQLTRAENGAVTRRRSSALGFNVDPLPLPSVSIIEEEGEEDEESKEKSDDDTMKPTNKKDGTQSSENEATRSTEEEEEGSMELSGNNKE